MEGVYLGAHNTECRKNFNVDMDPQIRSLSLLVTTFVRISGAHYAPVSYLEVLALIRIRSQYFLQATKISNDNFEIVNLKIL